MYYLNENYLNSLENSSLIENMKYNLGNVSINFDSNYDLYFAGTAKEVYTQERGTTVCDSSIKSFSNKNNCNIWNGNQASWKGKVAMLYPSDFGYASNTSNWSKNFKDADLNGISLNNWMFNNISKGSCFLSPVSYNHKFVLDVGRNGFFYIAFTDGRDGGAALRPVLSLKTDTKILDGLGSINDPYILSDN